jgi:capsular exopolysaccharide synthesis family protein
VVSLGLHREANLFDDQNKGLLGGLRSLFTGGQKAPVADNSLPIVDEASLDPEQSGQVQLSPEENVRAERYAYMLVGGLNVVQLERTNIVNISLQGQNPSLVRKVCDRVAELFIREDADRETAGARKAYEDLGNSIDELKSTIVQQENTLIASMQSGNLPLGDHGGDLRAENLKVLQMQRNEAELEVQKLDAMYTAALASRQNGDISPIVPDNKAIMDSRLNNLKNKAELDKRVEEVEKKIDEAIEEREKLLSKYTPEHPKVIEKVAQINELTNQRERLKNEVAEKSRKDEQKLQEDILSSLRSQLGSARTRLGRAVSAFEQAAYKANNEGVAEIELTTLKSELKSNHDLLDTYTQRQKEQELALSTGRPNNISIQSPAVTPSSPIGPQRGRNILVAFLMSLAAGIGLAFLLDYLDDSVRTSEDISRHLGLPTLALIPHYLVGAERKKLLSVNGNGNGNGHGPSAALITLDERHSPMAEAYRHLRTSLLFSSAGKPPKTILVTSSQPSEGKTTTAINTAITLAQSDADVVIIDCDLRRPRLHTHFGLENTRGLTNYLSGDKDTGDLIRTYKDLPRLKIVTSGPIPPNPAELLSSNEMRNLLQFMSGRFQHVIIDSPPAISFTDAAILSTLVDGVVLVAMANKSSIHLMRQFKHRVSSIGARIYGVVLNGLKADSVEYEYYGSGYYKYYSQADDDESTPFLEPRETTAEHVQK